MNTAISILPRRISPLFGLLCALAFCSHQTQAAPAATNESGVQLAIELRDGSRVVGKSAEDALAIHSAALGDMKLPWAGVRSIEYAGTNTSTARLAATNGDEFAVTLDAEALRVETAFGRTEMPLNLIRSVKVMPPGGAAAGAGTARLSIELRDGSHVVGKGLDDSLGFHSPAMGDLKLTWAGIRSIDYVGTNTDIARLTAANGDVYEARFDAPVVRVETSFGKTELPVNLIRGVKVSVVGNAGQLALGLVALWPGEGDGNDSVGGNNGALRDITFVQGKVGRAFAFNGTTSRIKIPANSSLDVGAGDGFTLMAWVKPSSFNERGEIFEWSTGQAGLPVPSGPPVREFQTLDALRAAGQPDPWGVHLLILSRGESEGAFVGNVHGTDGQEHVISSPPRILATDNFQHIALTYDKTSGVARLFCNGTIVTEQNIGRFTPQTSYDLYLGTRPAGASMNSFSGLMDEAAIFNRALTVPEIQAICTEQNHGVPPPPPPEIKPATSHGRI